MADVITLSRAETTTTTDLRPPARGAATYTVKQVAELLGLSLGGTYQALRAGEIPAKRIGGRWVVPVRRFHAWLDAEENEATPGRLVA
ncbi:helix-turn-helix domain-containing protein [Actinoplanes sp. M2I2]|uniref:helix-turn-helix domain-containing protein n=1 Tax=Actinoplanes sp. M2I2 TaxID=1734444 RepID=UPI00202037F3|nr:helix-turn-helix domain-containing protein [Actinoplanes sp. M2I2]